MTGNRMQATGRGGLVLVKKPVQRVEANDVEVLREGSTGRVVTMLPRVWAVAETPEAETAEEAIAAQVEAPNGSARPKVELAFYRKYTEALLRRYAKLSMEAGRVPSLLGRELFRGHVTSYKVHSFEDVVIFCHDVERCLKRLTRGEREVIRRVALQEYSHVEAAALMGLSLRTVFTRYAGAVDLLTGMLMEAKMLEPLKSCQ